MTVHIILSKFVFLIILCAFSWISDNAFAQEYLTGQNVNITFCTTSIEEQNKCVALSLAMQRDSFYPVFLNCRQGANKDDCMMLLDQNLVDITTLDAGEVFIGGRYHSLVPIAQEAILENSSRSCQDLSSNDPSIYPDVNRKWPFNGDNRPKLCFLCNQKCPKNISVSISVTYGSGESYYYSVAAVKRGSLPDVRRIHDLKGKKACFAGVGTLAGWAIPIYILMKYANMEIYDCNNHVKSAIKYFGPSCAVNSLIDKYNPIGDNSDKLCQLCGGTAAGEKCTPSDPYYGYEGAFKCLIEKGEIAFLRHSTIQEILRRPLGFGVTRSPNDFELLCLDGSRRPINDYRSCNWGRAPSQAIVTSSAKSADERRLYQKFVKKLSQIYGGTYTSNNSNLNNAAFSNYEGGYNNLNYDPYNSLDSSKYGTYEQFHLFQSAPRFGYKRNLLFQDDSTGIKALEEPKQTYTDFLGDGMKVILGVRECPVGRMTLCVTSDQEMEKCVKMKIAMKAQLLKPEMICYKGHSQINCMQAIKNGVADVGVFDAGDVYTAGLNYDLIPFMSEIYNLETPEYYVVAVAKEEDPDTELTYLKGKYTCHGGINTAAGWIVPLAFLISNGWIRSYGCDSVRAAAEYFTKSCVPGAISAEYNTGVPYDNMCDLCHGSSYRYCRRDASEDYFGHTGAFRCLVEGGGQVAFVKHTTVMENTDGKRREYWARNTFRDEFELLCPDGTRGQINDFKKCALGKVKANAIMARGGFGYNETEINAFINLFLYTQQFYGSKDIDDFSMFSSPPPYSNLIFQDATTQLLVVPPSQRYYSDYLGKNFMRAKRIVDCFANAHISRASLVLILSAFLGLFQGFL